MTVLLQNLDNIHTVGALCSLAANGAYGVKGGNYQIFENFLARSGANVHLNTTVCVYVNHFELRLLKPVHLQVLTITATSTGGWSIKTLDSEDEKTYDDVIIAAPFHQTGITIQPSMWSFTKQNIATIPKQPYVHLHVTLLSTTAPHPDPEYFGLKPGDAVPQTILTTYEGVRKGGKEPEFNSLTYHGLTAPGRDEWVVKIFSMQEISDDWLARVFDGQVGWVHRKEVSCMFAICKELSG